MNGYMLWVRERERNPPAKPAANRSERQGMKVSWRSQFRNQNALDGLSSRKPRSNGEIFMSHFFTVVITPILRSHFQINAGESQIEKEVERLLEPFDENMKVEPYYKTIEHDYVVRIAQDIGVRYGNLHEHPAMVKYFGDYNGDETNLRSFEGDLQYQTTYNPNSKWDWYSYGGRYDGQLLNQYRDGGDGGFNFAASSRQSRNNIAFCDKVLEAYKEERSNGKGFAFAVVTPDGKWHERGRMGWWAIVTNADDCWTEKSYKLLEQYPDNLCAGMDLHI